MNNLDETVILNELRTIQKDKANWKINIDLVANYLNDIYSIKVKSKALWMIGEMGLVFPEKVEKHVDTVTGFLENEDPKLQERSLNALGRIGRADRNLIIPYFDLLMKTHGDESEKVRLAFVWACENIATNAPELFCNELELFFDMIQDPSEKVCIEAPEMFRVIGKRKP